MKDADLRSFIDRERQRLIHYVRSFLKDTTEMDAEDVVHDVLVKMLEKPLSSGPLENMTGYVYRAMKNRVIDSVRTRKQTVSLDAEVAESGMSLKEILRDINPSALEQLQSQQGRQALFEALTKLSEIERRVIIAQEFEGVSFRELSASMNVPQNTLLSHKSRALKKLKGYLSSST